MNRRQTIFRKPNSAALAWLLAGAVWFAMGTTWGLFSAAHLIAPELFDNISWLVFGRTRPVHVNTVIFGFVAPMLIGAALHYVPALLKTRLWSEPLGWLAWLAWNAAVASGFILLPLGITQGREYAEYIFPFDVCIMVALVLLIVNLVMTIATRREPLLYVSVWYVVGMAVWTAGVYPIGNVMWQPATGAMPGVLDSIFLWFYGHNLVGLLLTPLATAAAYFVVPRVTRTPLYSHTLSLVGFWILLTLYTHIGAHHLLQAPVPNWLKTLSVVDSMAMMLPVFTVLMNLWLTARGRGGRLWRDVGGRFVMFGLILYFVTCVQGPLQSLPSVQRVTHFTNWTIGHAHIAVLGFAGFIALGAMWHTLPGILGRRLFSTRLVSVQFGLLMTGVVGFFLVLSIAGLVQGTNWANGNVEYNTLPMMPPYMILRGAMGLLIVTAAWVGLYNCVKTIRRKERATELATKPVANSQ
ncbi:MAG: cbb3-type cytochrome c oxidase subunit I [Phycisphaerae bacterium]|nr:cbb3-type cytochrome c oxidase subunit I [Phycisphaerae bacterium]